MARGRLERAVAGAEPKLCWRSAPQREPQVTGRRPRKSRTDEGGRYFVQSDSHAGERSDRESGAGRIRIRGVLPAGLAQAAWYLGLVLSEHKGSEAVI